MKTASLPSNATTPRMTEAEKARRRLFRRPLSLVPGAPVHAELERAVDALVEAWAGDVAPEPKEAAALAREYMAAYLERKRGERKLRQATLAVEDHARKRIALGGATAPRKVVDAWMAGDLETVDAWVTNRLANEVRKLTRPSRDPSTLSRALLERQTGAVGLLRNAVHAINGSFREQAREFFSVFEETRGDVPRILEVLDDLVAEERAERDAAEAERERAREERLKTKPISAAVVRERLGATKVETDRWVADGRLPVFEWMPFRKWGKELRVSLHDPLVVAGLAGDVEKWREKDREDALARRRVSARATALARAGGKLRAGLAKRAGLPFRDGSIEAVVVVASSDAVRGAFDAVRVPVAIPWPDGVDPVGDGKPSNAEKVLAAARLAAKVDAERIRLQAKVDLAVKEATRDVPSASAPRLHAHLNASLLQLSNGVRDIDVADDVRKAFGRAATAVREDMETAGLREVAGLVDYAGLFPVARRMRRRLVLHLGPTNSGKTHEAVEEMVAAGSGAYLAPLRLMALETYDRLVERGLPAAMVTGEEHLGQPDAPHVAYTVEMADMDREVDVAVIDEVQMILDRQRGWAWTQAIVGTPARTVHMTGSADALSHVQRAAAMTGDELFVVHHERKNPLEVLDRPVDKLLPGDAVVAFSRAEIMALRRQFGETTKVATVYGALGPEVRRSEAKRFRTGAASVLVATDAIAMGLNLPIKRVLFSALRKYDGVGTRDLTHSEIRQIGGRAGRYGMTEAGQVGLLGRSLGGSALNERHIPKALASSVVPPLDVRLPVMPPWRAVEAVSRALATENLHKIMFHVAGRLLASDPILVPADMGEMLSIAAAIEWSGLPLRERFGYLGCPLDTKSANGNSDDGWRVLSTWSSNHAKGKPNPAPKTSQKEIPGNDVALQDCERVAKRLSAYLWLSQRWPSAYADAEAAQVERARVNALIEGALARKSLARGCRSCGKKLPNEHGFAICDRCYQARRFY